MRLSSSSRCSILRFIAASSQPVEDGLVAAVAVVQAFVHPADGGGADAGIPADLVVVAALVELLRHLQPLGQSLQLLDGADVREKALTFLNGLERQNALEELLHLGTHSSSHGNSS